MKKHTRTVLLVSLIVVLVAGGFFLARRVCPLPEVDRETVWITVEDNRSDPPVKLELNEGETDVLIMKLNALKMKWSGGRVHPFPVGNVQYFVDYMTDGKPFHLVLGDPCFAYESADRAKYWIVQDDAYRRLMEELRGFAKP